MRRRQSVTFALCLFTALGAAQGGDLLGALPDGFGRSLDTASARIAWRDDSATPEEVGEAAALGERLWAEIDRRLGPADPSLARVQILLEGEAQGPDGRYRVPHVDGQGRVHLFRYPDGYFGALAHELVHAYRRGVGLPYHGFLEEGFAHLVAYRLRPRSAGFPLYGFPLTVVAGHWIERGEYLPLADLRARHTALSLPCMAQSYSLRFSFFLYLGGRFGDAAVIELAGAPDAGSDVAWERVLGVSFARLVDDWYADIRDRYAAHPHADRLARLYRTTTPVQNWPVCSTDGPR